MTASQEIVRLPCDESLTTAGVTYLEKNLGRILAPSDPRPRSSLRQVVASVAADLALRRWLDQERIPYSLLDDEPFTRPDWPRLLVGGRRVIMQTSLITSRRAIRRIRSEPTLALDAPAAVAAATLGSSRLSEGDLLVFALFLTLETRSLTDLERAVAAGNPIRLLATPPYPSWSHPLDGVDLGTLTLSTDSVWPEVQIQGLLPSRAPWLASFALEPASPFHSPPLHSLTGLHSRLVPSGRILAYAQTQPPRWQIRRSDWCNLWLYGMEIVLLGWKTVRDFRSACADSIPWSGVGLGFHPAQRSCILEARRLQPLARLADRLRRP